MLRSASSMARGDTGADRQASAQGQAEMSPAGTLGQTSPRGPSNTHGQMSPHNPAGRLGQGIVFEQTGNARANAGAGKRTVSTANRNVMPGSNTGRAGNAGLGKSGAGTAGGAGGGAGASSNTSDPHQQFHRRSIGDWDFCRTIGAGSMGKVKLARHRVTGEICAVKVVPRAAKIWQRQHAKDAVPRDSKEAAHRQRAYDKEVARDRRTIREGALGRIMYHPYICRLYEMFAMTNHYYMLFEYVSGGQMLDYIVSHGSLKEPQARRFCRGIASALCYCHANNIVHRDLKIENIMISRTGQIKLIDFGLSNLFDGHHLLRTYCGSLYFAAPELLCARPYIGPEVDVWSFGVVLYVLVCGKVPFDDQSVSALHDKIKRGRVRYPPGLSADCVSLLSQMLVVDPRRRASLRQVMRHPWMTRGYPGPPRTFMPRRVPLTRPLDSRVVCTIVQLQLAHSAQQVSQQLGDILDSDDYMRCVDNWRLQQAGDPRYDATLPDPTAGYHPLVSIYFLVREMLDRKAGVNGSAQDSQVTQTAQSQVTQAPIPQDQTAQNQMEHQLRAQEPARAHTNTGDQPTSPRLAYPQPAYKSPERANPFNHVATSPTTTPPHQESGPANSLLRRLSTKVGGGHHEKHSMESPFRRVGSVKVTSKEKQQLALEKLPPLPATARLQIRQHQRTVSAYSPRERERRENALVAQTAQRRLQRERQEETTEQARASAHTRKTSFSVARARRYHLDADAPPVPRIEASARDSGGFFDEVDTGTRAGAVTGTPNTIDVTASHRKPLTDSEIIRQFEMAAPGTMPSIEYPKTLFLKGFFSVQTTSTKPLPVIRYAILSVLPKMNVKYTEVRGGFVCIYYARAEHAREELAHADSIQPALKSPLAQPSLSPPTTAVSPVVAVSPMASPDESLTSTKKDASVVDMELQSPGSSGSTSPGAGTSAAAATNAPATTSTNPGTTTPGHRRHFSLGNAFLRRRSNQRTSMDSQGSTLPVLQVPSSPTSASPAIPKTPAPANVERHASRSSGDSSDSIPLDDAPGASDMLISSRVEQANRRPVHRALPTARAPVKFEIHIVKVHSWDSTVFSSRRSVVILGYISRWLAISSRRLTYEEFSSYYVTNAFCDE